MALKIKNSTYDVASAFLCYVYVIASVCEYFLYSDAFLRIAQIAGVLALCVEISRMVQYRTILWYRYTFVVLFFAVTGVVSTLAYHAWFHLSITYILANTGVALAFVNVRTNPLFYTGIFFGSALIFGVFIGLGVHPSFWGKWSFNYVSVISIYIASLYYISSVSDGRRITLIPAVIVFLICLAAIGRSGIISSALLLLSIAFALLRSKSSLAFQVALLGGGIFLLLNAGIIIETVSEGVDGMLVQFERKGFESLARQFILIEYWDRLDFYTMIFGVDPRAISFAYSAREGMTLHNSYLAMHSTYGFGFFIIIFVIGLAFWNHLKNRLWLAILMLVILTRSSTDTVLLTSGLFFGVIIMYAVVYYDVVKHASVRA